MGRVGLAVRQPRPSCDDEAPQSQTVVCQKDNVTLPDSQCAAAKPPTTRTLGRVDGCVVDWNEGQFSNWSSTCSTNASRSRQVTCMRTGAPSAPLPLPDSSCTRTKPIEQETGQTVTSSCTYSWEYSAWGPYSATCGAATRTRTVTGCKRSDGASVATNLCTGPQESLTENSNQTSGCPTYPGVWQAGAAYGPYGACTNGKYSRSAQPVCVKNGGNVNESECDPATKPAPTVQENNCTQTCGALADNGRAQYDAVHTANLGNLPASLTWEQAAAEAQARCNAYISPHPYSSKGCQVNRFGSGNSYNVEFRGYWSAIKYSFEGAGYFRHSVCTGG